MSGSYDSWKTRAPEDEPGYDPGEPEVDGVECCVCGHFIADDADDDEAYAHNGAWYCADDYFALPAVQAALQAVGERGDYE